MLEALIEFDPEASAEALKGVPKCEGGTRNIYFEFAPATIGELNWSESRLAASTRVRVLEMGVFGPHQVGEAQIGSTLVRVSTREVSASCDVYPPDMPHELAYTLASQAVRDISSRGVNVFNLGQQTQPENDNRDRNRSGGGRSRQAHSHREEE